MAISKNSSRKRETSANDALKILINKYIAFEATKSVVIAKGFITREQCESLFDNRVVKDELSNELKKLSLNVGVRAAVSDKTENIDSVLSNIINVNNRNND